MRISLSLDLGEALPDRVWELVYFPRFVLLIGPAGEVAGMFYGTNDLGLGNAMADVLVRLGLF